MGDVSSWPRHLAAGQATESSAFAVSHLILGSLGRLKCRRSREEVVPVLPARLRSHRRARLASRLFAAGGAGGGSGSGRRLSIILLGSLISSRRSGFSIGSSCSPSAASPSSKCPVPGGARRGAPGAPAQPSGPCPEPPRATHAPGGSALPGGHGRLPRNVIAAGGERGRPRRRCRGGGGQGRAGLPPGPPIAAVPFPSPGSRRPAAAAAAGTAGAARAGSFWTSPP